jgi:hypothetical protein
MPHEHSSDCIGEEFAQSLYCLFAVALMCSIAIGPGEALVEAQSAAAMPPLR